MTIEGDALEIAKTNERQRGAGEVGCCACPALSMRLVLNYPTLDSELCTLTLTTLHALTRSEKFITIRHEAPGRLPK